MLPEIHLSVNTLDRYFERVAIAQRARSTACPTCQAAAGAQCVDRWGQPTNLVHEDRHTAAGSDPATDPYRLEA